jgi:hypothetical protein
MGDLPNHFEKILITLPWPEPADLIKRLQKRFPEAGISYQQVGSVKNVNAESVKQFSDGKPGRRQLTLLNAPTYMSDGR